MMSRPYGGTALSFDQLDGSLEEKALGGTIILSLVDYTSHVDCPGKVKYVKEHDFRHVTDERCDLVISATDGKMAQIRKHVLWAH